MSRTEKVARLASTTITVVLAVQLVWHFLPDRLKNGARAKGVNVIVRVKGIRQARADQARLMWELYQLASLCPHKLAAEVDRMGHGR
jgi:hypothetical protein